MSVKTEKELAKAVENKSDTIEIEGDLAQKVIKIKATGNVAWGVAIGAIGVAVAAIWFSPATLGTSGVASLVAGSAAAGILGGGVATTAVLIAVAAGGIGVLNSLRDYKIVKQSDNKVTLKR